MNASIPNFNAYRGRSVLITGGLGFIGSNLARRLILDIGDVEVIILDPLMPDQGGNIFNIADIADRVTLHTASMGEDWAVNHLVGGVDYIFNLAGSVSHIHSMQYPSEDLDLNCRAQLVLLEACRNFNPHAKIVFSSTRQVYGKPVYLPLDEQHRIDPLDVNGINKYAAENYHLLYHRVYGMRCVCLRLTNTYGPRQLVSNDRHGFVGWFIRKAMDGEEIELFGEGRQKRDMNYVDDVVDALLLAGASEAGEGEVFNLGGNEPITLAELADILISVTGRGSVRHAPFPPERQLIEIGNSYSSYKKIESTLNWRPRTSLREGLARTVQFYEQYQKHYWNGNVYSLT